MEAKQADESKYWTAVRENPADFTSWSALILAVDQKPQDIKAIREAYDGFLEEYPLCYVYWKKYAEHEMARGDAEIARKTYERGVHAIPHSVDLWAYYCSFLTEKSQDVADIRSVFERAVAVCGTDYLAGQLWDKYLEFEMGHKADINVAQLFVRVLGIPLENLGKYYERWRSFAATRPVAELLTPEEAEAWAGEDDSAKREKLNSAREQLYHATLAHLSKRQAYEVVIRDRPYFHVKPLTDNELVAWHGYLTFEEKEGDFAKVVKLYERCLVACCNYPEFWRRYCVFLESQRAIEQAREVWVRATTVFLKRRPDIHLDFAEFEEAQGQVENATNVFNNVLAMAPNHVESTIRWAEFNRRQGDPQAACRILSEAIASPQFESAAAFLAMYLARYQAQILGDEELARATYRDAVAKTPENKNIWLAAINFETMRMRHVPSRMDEEEEEENSKTNSHHGGGLATILDLYARAVHEDSKLGEEDRVELWHNYIDFVHAFHPDPRKIHQLRADLLKAFPNGKAKASKKRALQGGRENKTQAKQPRTSPVASPTLPAAASPLVAASPTLITSPQLGTMPTPQLQAAPAQYPPQGYGGMYGQYGAYPAYAAYQATAAPAPAGAWPQQQAAMYPTAAAPAGGQYAYPGYPQQPTGYPPSMDTGYG